MLHDGDLFCEPPGPTPSAAPLFLNFWGLWGIFWLVCIGDIAWFESLLWNCGCFFELAGMMRFACYSVPTEEQFLHSGTKSGEANSSKSRTLENIYSGTSTPLKLFLECKAVCGHPDLMLQRGRETTRVGESPGR
jgi:hypothetical protein